MGGTSPSSQQRKAQEEEPWALARLRRVILGEAKTGDGAGRLAHVRHDTLVKMMGEEKEEVGKNRIGVPSAPLSAAASLPLSLSTLKRVFTEGYVAGLSTNPRDLDKPKSGIRIFFTWLIYGFLLCDFPHSRW